MKKTVSVEIELEHDFWHDGKEYTAKLGDGGIALSEKGKPYLQQYLTYYDFAMLVLSKNTAIDEADGIVSNGEKLWRERVAKQLLSGMNQA